jgi:hypothetical protein
MEKPVSGHSYLDMLQISLFPQFNEDSGNYIFQQDGAPLHWHSYVRCFLNEVLPRRRIGRGGPNDLMLYSWPPRSPDFTTCDFFFWGYVKDAVYVSPLPTTLDELKNRIVTAMESVTTTCWSEYGRNSNIVSTLLV